MTWSYICHRIGLDDVNVVKNLIEKLNKGERVEIVLGARRQTQKLILFNIVQDKSLADRILSFTLKCNGITKKVITSCTS